MLELSDGGNESLSILSDLEGIAKNTVGRVVPRPSGQLSGHAGGLPFETIVHELLKGKFDARAWRHYEALNEALLESRRTDGWSNPPANFVFGPPDVNFLAARGKGPLSKWSPSDMFTEKQNDTAESIVFQDAHKKFFSGLTSFVDVKTQTLARKAQPPNIISAQKIAKLAEIVLKERLTCRVEILYLGISFDETTANNAPILEASKSRAISLMKIEPKSIYVNWAAAMQIQFHPSEVDQSFPGSANQWLAEFLRVYCEQLEKRVKKQNDEIERLRSLVH